MHCPETERLRLYARLKDPISVIVNWKLFAAFLVAAVLYFLLFILLPNTMVASPICSEGEFSQQCLALFDISNQAHWQRGLFVFMLTIFIRMWYVYFKSSFQPHELSADGSIKPDFNYEYAIQSLRRFLSLCAMQWQWNQSKDHVNDKSEKSDRYFEMLSIDKDNVRINEFLKPKQDEGVPLNEAFRRKASMSVEVAALFMVIVTLIIDKSSDVIINYQAGEVALDLWAVLTLSLSSIFGIISFICFLISVDSMDTTFNKFVSKSTRHVALQYFYQITSNPRYAAVVCMMLSMIFFFTFFSAFLGTLSLTALMYIGFRLWFPDITQALSSSGFYVNHDINPEEKSDIVVTKRRTISFSFFLLVLVFELIYLIATGLYNAGIFLPYI